ncbi:MAG: hypothetical protein ACPGVG_15205 [Mycobacterium sp.]
MAVRYDSKGLRDLIAENERMSGRLLDLTPVTQKHAALLEGVIIKTFRREKGPNEEPWASLAPSTLARRRKGKRRRRSTANRRSKPRKAGILRNTGQLFGSVFGKADGSKGIAYGFGAKHGLFSQFGKGRMHRPFLPVDASGNPLFEKGKAKRWLDKLNRDAIDYIIHGAANVR